MAQCPLAWNRAADMITTQAALLASARRAQLATDEYNIQTRTSSSEPTKFPINSYVLEEFPDSGIRRGPPKGKIYPNKRGPLRVVNYVGDKYAIQDLITGKVHDTHVSRLNEYLFDENDISFTPHDAARRDNHEHWVEAILDHKGHQRDKTNMTFEVQWCCRCRCRCRGRTK